MKTITIILLMVVGLSSNAQTTEIIRLDYPTNVNTVIIIPNQVSLNNNYFFLDYNIGQGAVFSSRNFEKVGLEVPSLQNFENQINLPPLNLNNIPNNNILFTRIPIIDPKTCKKGVVETKKKKYEK